MANRKTAILPELYPFYFIFIFIYFSNTYIRCTRKSATKMTVLVDLRADDSSINVVRWEANASSFKLGRTRLTPERRKAADFPANRQNVSGSSQRMKKRLLMLYILCFTRTVVVINRRSHLDFCIVFLLHVKLRVATYH